MVKINCHYIKKLLLLNCWIWNCWHSKIVSVDASLTLLNVHGWDRTCHWDGIRCLHESFFKILFLQLGKQHQPTCWKASNEHNENIRFAEDLCHAARHVCLVLLVNACTHLRRIHWQHFAVKQGRSYRISFLTLLSSVWVCFPHLAVAAACDCHFLDQCADSFRSASASAISVY